MVLGSRGSDHATKFARSEHLLFVTLKPPTEPWSDDGIAEGAETVPWITALQHACEWGRGAKTERQAAERVVRAFFALGLTQSKKNGRFRYDGDLDHYLDSGLANPRFFNLESFLRHVARQIRLGHSVSIASKGLRSRPRLRIFWAARWSHVSSKVLRAKTTSG